MNDFWLFLGMMAEYIVLVRWVLPHSAFLPEHRIPVTSRDDARAKLAGPLERTGSRPVNHNWVPDKTLLTRCGGNKGVRREHTYSQSQSTAVSIQQYYHTIIIKRRKYSPARHLEHTCRLRF